MKILGIEFEETGYGYYTSDKLQLKKVEDGLWEVMHLFNTQFRATGLTPEDAVNSAQKFLIGIGKDFGIALRSNG